MAEVAAAVAGAFTPVAAVVSTAAAVLVAIGGGGGFRSAAIGGGGGFSSSPMGGGGFRSAAISPGAGGFRGAPLAANAFARHGFRGGDFDRGFRHHHGRGFAFGVGLGYGLYGGPTATTMMTIMIIRTIPTPIMMMAAATWYSGACSPLTAGESSLSRSAADRDRGEESGGLGVFCTEAVLLMPPAGTLLASAYR